ncbi:MAG: glutathionylspermidine synthase family protein, partial [Plesiomonas sp.]
MFRIPCKERPHWRQQAAEFGFGFHTMYGEPYWDETAYYQFSLQQIEEDLEQPTQELHQMCLEVVDQVVRDEALLRRFQIPQPLWQQVADSWHRRDPSLYSRLDLAYDGQSPAKLYENNADTPTSLFETAFWQWLWLEDNVDRGQLRRDSDQFNRVQ